MLTTEGGTQTSRRNVGETRGEIATTTTREPARPRRSLTDRNLRAHNRVVKPLDKKLLLLKKGTADSQHPDGENTNPKRAHRNHRNGAPSPSPMKPPRDGFGAVPLPQQSGPGRLDVVVEKARRGMKLGTEFRMKLNREGMVPR